MIKVFPKFSLPSRRNLQRGVSSLGMAFTVLATGIASVGLSRQAVVNVESSQGRAQGVLLDKLNNAVNTYMQNNFTAVINNGVVTIPTGGTIPAGSSLQPTLAQLQGMGVLDATFQAAAINGGAYQLLITRLPANCWLAVPNNCNLQSRVWIDQPFLNITATGPSTRLLQAAVAAAPGSVGTSNNETPTLISGPTWSLANPVAGTPAGILMAVGGYASSAFANYLPLRGGTMNGGIDMGGNSVGNAGSVTTTGGVTVGGTLSAAGGVYTPGAITADGTLRAGGNKTQLWNQAGEGGVLTLGDATGQSMHQELIGGRMRWINGAWNKDLGGIDQAGNLNAAGGVTAAGAVSATGTVYANNGHVQIAAAAWSGWGCGANGDVTTDPNGKILSCQGGVWTNSASNNGAYVFSSSYTGDSGWIANSSGKTQFLVISGGNGGANSCHLNVLSDVWGGIANQFDNSQDRAKTCQLSLPIPSGTSYYVQSTPYGSAPGIYAVWTYQ